MEYTIHKKALHVPKLDRTLISVKDLCNSNHEVKFTKKGGEIKQSNGTKIIMETKDRLYTVPKVDDTSIVSSLEKERQERQVVQAGYTTVNLEKDNRNMFEHERYGHPGKNQTRVINKYLKDNMREKFVELHEEPDCASCLQGKKGKKKPWKSKSRLEKKEELDKLEPLDIVAMDHSGRARIQGWGRKECYSVMVDKKSLHIQVRATHSEKTATEELKEYLTKMKRIGRLKTDNAKVFTTSQHFKDTLSKHKIDHQTTIPYTSNQNSLAEAMIGVINREATTLLNQRDTPRRFWPQAVQYYEEIHNRTPRSSRGGSIPLEVVTRGKVKAKPEDLKVFGCLTYTHIRKEERKYGKYDKSAQPGIFMGFAKDKPG